MLRLIWKFAKNFGTILVLEMVKKYYFTLFYICNGLGNIFCVKVMRITGEMEKKQMKTMIAREITRENLDEMSLYEKLDLVRLRPGMYLGANSVSKLYTFISGFRFALSYVSPKLQSEGYLPFNYFNAYVAERYNCSGSMGWANILLKVCNDSEEDGLKLFFEVLDEFRALRIEKVWQLQLTEQNICYNRTEKSIPQRYYDPDNSIPRYSYTDEIYKIKLSDGAMLLAVKKENDGYAWIEKRLCYQELCYQNRSINKELEECFGEITKSAWKESAENFSELLLLF